MYKLMNIYLYIPDLLYIIPMHFLYSFPQKSSIFIDQLPITVLCYVVSSPRY